MKSTQKFLLHSAAVFSLLITMPVHANFSWTFTSGCGGSTGAASCTKSSTNSGTTIDVTATGWASSVSNTIDDGKYWTNDTNNNSANAINSTLEAATLKRWDGLAVNSTGESTNQPDHATDNNGKLEAILYDFGGDAVTLDTVTVGWHEDADFSLLRYTGSDTADLTGKSFNNLTSNGWELVGNYTCGSNPACSNTSDTTDRTAHIDGRTGDHYTGPKNADGSIKSLGTGDLSSSYWLIAALNSAFWDNKGYIGNDYFKVKNLTGSFTPTAPGSGSVPEPSGILLIVTGLIGWHLSNSKRNKITSSSATVKA